MKKKAAFKPYQQHQMTLLPINLDELIPENHMVRVIDRAVDKMNCEPLFAKYEGGGTSSYNPIMMLKVIVYAYADMTFSSRKISKATRENINFLWLTGNVQLDHMTINRFRSERLKGIIDNIFTEVVSLLIDEKYITFEKYFLDGTKIEANASKYSWVWGKSTKRYKENLKAKVKEKLIEIDMINNDENSEYGDNDLPEMGNKEINSQAIREAVANIDEKLKMNPDDKKLKSVKKELETDCLPRMEKYEKQEEILEDRRSYSKTDTDATFMRMKEDHMKNGQLKPGYNVQIGTENRYITGFGVYQKAGDSTLLKEHLDHLKALHDGTIPKNVIADAGYGSEENYEYFLKEKITPYVKYNTFHKEASKKWIEDITKSQNWSYDKDNDVYFCTMKRPLVFMWEQKRKSDNGYESLIRVYECLNCSGCPHREKCVKSDDPFANRRINVNRRLNELKNMARALLTSEMGLEMRSQRPVEVENAFGNIKGNFGVRRFLLRGLEKVKIEWGLYSIAHNMRKMAAVMG